MSKFDFVKRTKEEVESKPEKVEVTSKPTETTPEDSLSVQVSLPIGETNRAMRKPRQMTIHEDVYRAAASYAKKNNMSVSRLFETVMAQALGVDPK